MDFRISLAGLMVGFLIGLTGMGGGSLLAPIMILLFRVPPLWAVTSDVTYSAITKGFGTIIHARQRQIDFRAALWLACGSVPAILVSVLLVQYIRAHYGHLINTILLHAIGYTLVLVAVLLLARPYLLRYAERRARERKKAAIEAGQSEGSEEAAGRPSWYRRVLLILAGAFVGFLVGLTSVGSGTLIIVTLAFLYPELGPKKLVGTDIFQAFLLLLAGMVGYLSSGSINWEIVGLLLLGSLPGVYIGSKLSKFIPDQVLNPVLAIVLAVSGLKLI
ncbi:sulfite exporter TauE/SafE family protein [Thermogemmatispora carboxidivorans]|uniref:sulfite exporter TauE/SafE family protein n=1 Tax=Thermogemmatispora carboxidivorans TaxID=1382306 RepID=UPI00069BA902|nr:sulfite exporter TauE/SafE family protein [Thermogemmatispora carboxidivorans]